MFFFNPGPHCLFSVRIFVELTGHCEKEIIYIFLTLTTIIRHGNMLSKTAVVPKKAYVMLMGRQGMHQYSSGHVCASIHLYCRKTRLTRTLSFITSIT